ncbi:MAG: phosphoserine phosphatase SerB, partial [Nitrospinaceae bacterium]|nr:phosphoserine phosphatase SerB [Nitrospinaceae bacterium]NIS84842.1 phosphoserine phosphatase SerB [Nitrospinaceae bacterium]
MPDPSSPGQLHIHLSGQDRPGILAEALESIVSLGWHVIDIKQFVFNGLLNLSIFLESREEKALPPLREALLQYQSRAGIRIAIYPWDSGIRPDAPYKHRSVVTLLG